MRLQLLTQIQPKKIAGYALSLEGLDSYELSKAIPEINAQFGIYPNKFIKQSGLKCIVLCKNLSYAGQERSSIPDFRRRLLYVDTKHAVDEEYYRLIIHHEYFHIIDHFMLSENCHDNNWSKLNNSDFNYGSGGVNMRDSCCGNLAQNIPGFLTRYSTSAVEEDRAELFSHMIINYQYVEEKSNLDVILKAKVAYLQNEIANVCSDIDYHFWADRRDADLWQNH